MINYPTIDKVQSLEIISRHHISTYLSGLQAALTGVSATEISKIIEVILEAGNLGKMIFICGNGGSASTASHMACDLAKGARIDGFPPFRAIALTDSMSQLTAWANDTNYENCFAGQLEGLARPGDLLIAISGSGNSPNVLKAVEAAKKLEMTTIGFVGFKGGKLKPMVDHSVVVMAANIEQVEDVHMILEHTICTTMRGILQERISTYFEAVS
jgi:D-sedoheptulose 7-phosphate isomerase